MWDHRLTMAFAGRSLRVVCYHHFAAEPCLVTRGLGTTTHPEALRQQLDVFARHYQPIGLDQLLAGDIPDRALLVTIDDSYRSVLEVAAPEFRARGIPAVLFLNPAPVESPFLPLDNVVAVARELFGAAEVAELATSGALAPEEADTLMTDVVPRQSMPALQDIKARLLRRLGMTEEAAHRRADVFLRPDEVRQLANFGIEIGNHTMSHVHCRSLDRDGLVQEIIDSRDWIEDVTGRPVRSFSLPWGQDKDATAATLATARRSGHRATFLVQGRRNVVRPADDVWYRVMLTNETGWRLQRALEIMPILSTLKHGAPALDAPACVGLSAATA